MFSQKRPRFSDLFLLSWRHGQHVGGSVAIHNIWPWVRNQSLLTQIVLDCDVMWELCIRVKITLHMAEFQFPNTSQSRIPGYKMSFVYFCINIQQTGQDKGLEFSFLIGKVFLFPALLTSRRPMTASAWKPVVMFTALHILTKRHFNLVLRSQ